jgi:FkbM family methyltransferase
MTPEEQSDCESVWARVSVEHPEFTRAHDIANDYHAVREIVLGGSLSWSGANERFKPFAGARIMDVGANAGIYSAFCAANRANVTAYEPDHAVFALLSKVAEGTEKFKAVNKAIWKHSGSISFLSHASTVYGFERHNGGLEEIGFTRNERMVTEHVDCISFDEAIGDNEWDCVKVDIEGAEFETLLSASASALSRIKFMFVELHPWASDILYKEMLNKIAGCFNVEQICPTRNGRHEAIYCTKKGPPLLNSEILGERK